MGCRTGKYPMPSPLDPCVYRVYVAINVRNPITPNTKRSRSEVSCCSSVAERGRHFVLYRSLGRTRVFTTRTLSRASIGCVWSSLS